MRVTDVYFVRHGSTAYTEEPERFCGASDPSLSKRGIQQIKSLANGLRGAIAPAEILCSPSKRAVETAAILSEALRCDYSEYSELREIDFGSWEGLTREEVSVNLKPEYEKWISNPIEMSPPQAETSERVMERARRVRDMLISIPHSRVLVVGHKSFSRIAFGNWLGVLPSHVRSFLDLKPGALCCLELCESHARLSLLNWRPEAPE